MHKTLSTLLKRLDEQVIQLANVIPWSCPVPSFGDLSRSSVATLGLNPSNREFVDMAGNELEGSLRRFHTLKSLGITRWSDATSLHLDLIEESCNAYFTRNPYDAWFKELDYIVSGTNASYYRGSVKACHLDLIPYTTACKWTELSALQRTSLMALSGDTLGLLLRDSPVHLLVLNGRTVVDNFQKIADIELDDKEMPAWSLPRKSGAHVVGIAYQGSVQEISGVKLKRTVLVLGFNHNIQSSFGVTNQVRSEIRSWVAQAAREVLDEAA